MDFGVCNMLNTTSCPLCFSASKTSLATELINALSKLEHQKRRKALTRISTYRITRLSPPEPLLKLLHQEFTIDENHTANAII